MTLPDRILDALSAGPMTRAKLARTVGATMASAHSALARLRARGLVVPPQGKRGAAATWRRA